MMYYLERFGPISAAIIAVVMLVYFKTTMISLAAAKSIDVSTLYSSMFDWASIQTGFLFGVFGFVSGKSTGFMADVAKTEAMSAFNKYTRTAIFLGFLLTLASIPLMVAGFNFEAGETWKYVIFIGWSAFAIWSFLAFARVAYVFGVMLKVGDKTRVPG